MPRVTDLSVQKKNPDRYNLFVDDKFYCGIDLETIQKYDLRVGLELSDQDKEKIFEDSEIAKLYRKILDFIALRPRSRQEITQRLNEKIFKSKFQFDNQDQMVESILDRLERMNYLNEEEFVRWWIHQRIDHVKPNGFVKIKSELFQKGVKDSLVTKVWSGEKVDEEGLLELHYEKVKDKYDQNNPKEKKRLVDYLSRQGFRWEQIRDEIS